MLGFQKGPAWALQVRLPGWLLPTMSSKTILMTAKTTKETTVMVTLNLTTTLTRDEEWR